VRASMDQQPDLDSSHHESDLSVRTRIQGHEKSLEANPSDLASRMGLAQAHMHGENWMEAAEHLDKVVNDDPKNPKAPPLLARCYLSMGHMDKGELQCRAAAVRAELTDLPCLPRFCAISRCSGCDVSEGLDAHRQREQPKRVDAGGQDVRSHQEQQSCGGCVQAGRTARSVPSPPSRLQSSPDACADSLRSPRQTPLPR
jgi:hypothetical protein